MVTMSFIFIFAIIIIVISIMMDMMATCVQEAAAGSLEVAIDPAQYSFPTKDIPSLLTQNLAQVVVLVAFSGLYYNSVF